jgi:hypothetical protein
MNRDIGKFFCCSAVGSVLSCWYLRVAPRTVTKNYRREQNITWEENNCVEGNAYITINKQVMW